MPEDTTIRDSLARQRTHLANERTLLAYFRTGLGFFLAGAFLIRFEPTPITNIFSIGSMVFGAIVMVFGVWKFLTFRKKVS